MKMKTVYLLLCLLGVALPYWQFIPWVAQNGLQVPLFWHQLFANRISAFFAMDVLVSAITLMVFVRVAGSLCGFNAGCLSWPCSPSEYPLRCRCFST